MIARLIGIVAAFAMTMSAASAATFTSPEGNFTAEFPAAPTLQKSTGKTTGGIPYEQHLWSIEDKDGWWAVFMDIYSQSIRKNYDDNVRGAVAAVKGNLLSQKTIRQNGVEGRDIVVDTPQKGQEGQVHVRYLWIGNRFYQIMFSGKPGTATAPNVEAFLASFRTTK